MVSTKLSDKDYLQFVEDGFLPLGKVVSDEELAALNNRLDDIMLGNVQYGDKLLMQLDPNSLSSTTTTTTPSSSADEYSAYKAINVEVSGQSVGFKGASLAYRKIGEAEAGLECDPVFLSCIQKPLFRSVCDRVYGNHASIAVYRAMVMSKPADDLGGGTPLPWHQDGGDWWALDRDPLCFVWIALSPATRENGAVQIVKGSHKLGLLSKRGHTLSAEHIKQLVDDAPPNTVLDMELKPGEAVLCHNFLVHRSGINTTAQARRGFSVNYIDGRTKVLNPKPELSGSLGTPGGSFPIVFSAPF